MSSPGTDLERFRAPVSELTFVEKVTRAPAKPPKPAFDVEEIREHIATVQHKAMDELSGELGIRKKYLKSKRAPPEAAEDLDAFYKEQEEVWKAIVARSRSYWKSDSQTH